MALHSECHRCFFLYLGVMCRFDELVYKIAVYKLLLAVQLRECLIIAEVFSEDSGSLQYREVRRLTGSFECSLMLLTASAVVLCRGNTLKLHEFEGIAQHPCRQEDACLDTTEVSFTTGFPAWCCVQT